MFISYNWLKDYVKTTKSASEIGALLTLHTAEVEGVEDQSKSFENMVVGKVVELKQHPNADKLRIAMTDIGEKSPVQIVCGGSNLREGMIVPVALPGAFVKWHGEGDLIQLEPAKIRGESSHGMICAGEEINLPACPEGEITELHVDAKTGTPLAKALKLDDAIIEIDNKSLTHRPDLWGHYGIAREIAALTDSKLEKINPKTTAKWSSKSDKNLSVEVKDAKLCPRYTGIKISGIKVEESPEWLQQKLRSAGHATYNNIVDITNFIASELGQPMHAFDARFIDGGIIVRTAKNSEIMTTLDGKERKLTDKMLLICDHKKPVALAGIMGGANSDIKSDTTEIIFEAANFNAPNVRKTSVALGLRTESVQRFEKSLDPNLTELAIKRAIELTLELCPGAKLVSSVVDINNTKPKTLIIDTTTDRICNKIGIDIPESKIKKILESLEFKITKRGETLEVEVPSFRATKDIEGEGDIIEEVARIYGYENIPSTLPNLPAKLPEENRERFLKHKSRDIISLGLGFMEVGNYSFYSADDIKKCHLNESDHVKLLNYLSQDQTHMRVSLLPNMLKNLYETLKYESTPKLYEIGRTYRLRAREVHNNSRFATQNSNIEKDDYFPLEEKWITGVITGEKSFFKAKGSAEVYLEKFGAINPAILESKNKPAYSHPIKHADLVSKGQNIGQIYEVHPSVLKAYGIDIEVSVFEINFTQLVALGQREHKYIQLPKFPSMQLDVSVVLPEKITAASAEKEITRANKDLIKHVELFDIYRGKGLGENEKALAYHIELRADNRTLNDQEMTEVQKKIFENLEKLGGKIRGK